MRKLLLRVLKNLPSPRILKSTVFPEMSATVNFVVSQKFNLCKSFCAVQAKSRSKYFLGNNQFPSRNASSRIEEFYLKRSLGIAYSTTGPVSEAKENEKLPEEAGESLKGGIPRANGPVAENAEALALELPTISPWVQFLVKLRMLTALPWQRVKKGSVLSIKISGSVNEQLGFRFSATLSLPQIIENLKKAAVDPRVVGLVLKIEPVACGWGKLEEIARYVHLFKKSGKFSLAYMTVGGEKEYYLASCCDEIFTPPGAYVSLRGLSVQGQFLGGVLKKVGIEPQVERIGKYKSAGDQLLRSDMSEANREMLTAILDDLYGKWSHGVAKNKGKSVDEVESVLNSGIVDMEEFKDINMITDIKYESEVEELLKTRLKLNEKEKLLVVDNRKYSRVRPWTLGIAGSGDRIAIIRAVGAISRGRSSVAGITPDDIISKIRLVKESKQFKALVLRIDSPGGDALASDLMWHEIRELAKKKPVVASMADVAASGGYYMAMAASSIVAEELTLTGSIGVVLGKFNLKALYERIGLAKERISRGRFAELDADDRSFTAEEEVFFKKGAQNAYKSFRDKAAVSRSMEAEEMEQFAQGRVWTGKAAKERKLVDAIGGIDRAVAIAKEKAGIPADKNVRLVELSRQKPSIQMLLASGSSLATFLLGSAEDREAMIGRIVTETLLGEQTNLPFFEPQARMEDIWMEGFYTADTSSNGETLPRLIQTVLGSKNLL